MGLLKKEQMAPAGEATKHFTEGMALLQPFRNKPTGNKSQKKSVPQAWRARLLCNVDRLAIWGDMKICGTTLPSAPEFALPSQTTCEHQRTTELKATGGRTCESNFDPSLLDKTSLPKSNKEMTFDCYVMCSAPSTHGRTINGKNPYRARCVPTPVYPCAAIPTESQVTDII
jgi:hypothetical protein